MLPFGNISERIFTHTASHYACKHTTILAVWQGRKCRLRAARAKGDILFHEREYPPLNPPRERFRLAVSGLNNLYAFGMQLPARGVAAFGVARRFGLLLLSAAALPILWECTVVSVYRQSPQCGERSNAAFRRQSAAEQTSLAPHDSKARLQSVPNRRDSWRSHVHRT